MTNTHTIKKLQKEIEIFVEERDWHAFHSPKNLTMALSVEVAELVEIFQWQQERESYETDAKGRKHIEEEIGDVMIYLTTLAAKFDIDPIEAALRKITINKEKYPAERVRGKSLKYTAY